MKSPSVSQKTKTLSFLVRLLAFIVCAILSLTVILLPISTSAPAYIWVLMAVCDLALVFLLFRITPTWKAVAISLSGLLVVSFLAVVASQTFAMTPPIKDAQGKPLPGSIATLEKIELNGSQQWVSIRGNDSDNPVLLFLAGGPGGSQLATARFALNALEKEFVVVNWEQPGAGKSFDAVNRKTLTVDRYIEDTRALAEFLRERFQEDKVYVVGESWGSALGIMAIQRYPELFHAFIGTGQVVSFLDTDLQCYDFALNWARERGDEAKVKKLVSQGPPPYFGKGVAWKQATYLLDTFEYMNQNPAIRDNGFNTFRDLAAPEYGLYDKLNWFRGVLDTLDVVYPQLWDTDFREQATQLEVPVYFFIGRHDINAPVSLTQEYFEILEAPHKEIVWFEKSGHNPWVSESDNFVQKLVEIVQKNPQ
jgi:pimeloyl-ACP methyl ester carboxylesterase